MTVTRTIRWRLKEFTGGTAIDGNRCSSNRKLVLYSAIAGECRGTGETRKEAARQLVKARYQQRWRKLAAPKPVQQGPMWTTSGSSANFVIISGQGWIS